MLIQGKNLDEQIAEALSDERANDVAVFCASYKPVLGYLTELLKKSEDAREYMGSLYLENFDLDDYEASFDELVDDITLVAQGLAKDVREENSQLMARLYASDILAYAEVEQTGKLVGYASLLGNPLAVLEDMSVVRDLKAHTYAEKQATDFYKKATLNIYRKVHAGIIHQETNIPEREYRKRFGHSNIAHALSRIGKESVDRFVVKKKPGGDQTFPLMPTKEDLEEFYSDGVIQIVGVGTKKSPKPGPFVTYPSVDARSYKLVEQRKLI